MNWEPKLIDNWIAEHRGRPVVWCRECSQDLPTGATAVLLVERGGVRVFCSTACLCDHVGSAATNTPTPYGRSR